MIASGSGGVGERLRCLCLRLEDTPGKFLPGRQAVQELEISRLE